MKRKEKKSTNISQAQSSRRAAAWTIVAAAMIHGDAELCVTGPRDDGLCCPSGTSSRSWISLEGRHACGRLRGNNVGVLIANRRVFTVLFLFTPERDMIMMAFHSGFLSLVFELLSKNIWKICKELRQIFFTGVALRSSCFHTIFPKHYRKK